MKLKRITNVILLFLRVRCPLKTIIINFKLLPFKQAVHFPILIMGKCIFRSLKGRIVIKNNRIHPGMIRIGSTSWYPGPVSPCILTIDGTLIVEDNHPIGMSTYILVAKGATLKLGRDTIIGGNVKIMCFDSICFGTGCRITWETQFTDTTFHYIEKNNEIPPLIKPIIIGDFCWIGNRTTVSKGTVLPNYSIVASNSIINKDFSDYGEYCFYAGSPAKFKEKNIRRIFDENKERELDKLYGYTRRHL